MVRISVFRFVLFVVKLAPFIIWLRLGALGSVPPFAHYLAMKDHVKLTFDRVAILNKVNDLETC